jgi:nicotinate dehydrogenase subunit B
VSSRTYSFPFNTLAGIGPDCAVADVRPGSATVFCGTTNAYSSRAQVAALLGLPQLSVQIVYYESSSSFGGQQTANVDIPQAAALMSQLAGAPVRVQNMRWDEHGGVTYSPGELVDIRAGLDARGNIVGYHTTAFYPQYKTSAGTTEELLGTTTPTSAGQSGVVDPAPMYAIPNQQFLIKSLPLLNNWLKVQWIRGGSSPLMAFASEQMIDELAHKAVLDPVAFRLQNLTQAATRDAMLTVMNAATTAAGWQPKVAASKLSGENVVRGRGFAMYFYGANSPTATIADVEVNKETGKIVVKSMFSASAGGLIVAPGLVENQIAGAMVQMASRALVEQVGYSTKHVTTLDWASYPILRFKDSPKVTPVIVQRLNEPPALIGEPVSVPIPAAIANAFFDATGVRLTQAPMTPARVRVALGTAKG